MLPKEFLERYYQVGEGMRIWRGDDIGQGHGIFTSARKNTYTYTPYTLTDLKKQPVPKKGIKRKNKSASPQSKSRSKDELF
jgi:hypothetical protein